MRADEIIAEARVSAAQIIQEAEAAREDARKKLEKADAEAQERINAANDKASDITAAARLEARRVASKGKHEFEESKREMNVLQVEKRRFLRDASELLSAFTHVLDEMGRKLEKGNLPLDEVEPSKQETARMTLSFSPVVDEADDEVAIS
jgi:F0F1-type ATP synthase membrane subunit b/b'